MSDSTKVKGPCVACGALLEFAPEFTGSTLNCPVCGASTVLAPAAPAQPNAAPGIFEIVSAFEGKIARPGASFAYQIALMVVAAAMLLLPVIYVSIIVASAWGVYAWSEAGKSLFREMSPLLALIFWLGPLFAGVAIVFFMIKPLFARLPPPPRALALDPPAEPLLFAFVQQVCAVVGAPMPARIDVNCDINASAEFQRGAASFLKNDLVLTLGLPLVAGLDLRGLAGVVAHELGHFTQGFAMRLTYLVRRINFWFFRVSHERDSWDDWLADISETNSTIVLGIVWCARFGVWISRVILKLLMYAGLAISSHMQRQQEHDADTCEIMVAGSAAFEATMQRMHVLGAVQRLCGQRMGTSWKNGRYLPDDLPAFLLDEESRVPAGAVERLEDTMGLAEASWMDAHPSHAERIRHARQAAAPGIFRLEAPGRCLFANYEELSRKVTLLQYTGDMGLQRGEIRLVSLNKYNQTQGITPENENPAPVKSEPKRVFRVPPRNE